MVRTLVNKCLLCHEMRAFHLGSMHFGEIHFAEIHKIAGPLWESTFDMGFWVGYGFNLR